MSSLRSIFLILAACCTLRAISISEMDRVHKIRVTASNSELAQNTANYVAICAGTVNRTLACSTPPTRNIQITLVETLDSPDKIGYYNVQFTNKTPTLYFTYFSIRALLRRRQEELFHCKGDTENLLCYLAAALAYRETGKLAGKDDVSRSMGYTPARRQFAEKHFPNAESLLTSSFPPESPYLFELYAMHAELLLRCLERIKAPKGSIFQGMLKEEAEGKSADEALLTALFPLLPKGLTLQGWYERQVLTICHYERTPVLRETIETKVRHLMEIPILNGGDLDNVTTVHLEDMPAALSDFRLDKGLLRRRQFQMLSLQNEAPPLLKQAIGHFAKAIGLLADGELKDFRKEMPRAQKDFQQALKQQKHAEDVLEQIEHEHIPVNDRFQTLFDILQQYRTLDEETLPLTSEK